MGLLEIPGVEKVWTPGFFHFTALERTWRPRTRIPVQFWGFSSKGFVTENEMMMMNKGGQGKQLAPGSAEFWAEAKEQNLLNWAKGAAAVATAAKRHPMGMST